MEPIVDHDPLLQDPEWLSNALPYFRTKHPLYFETLKQLCPSASTFIQLLQVGQSHEVMLLQEVCKGEEHYLNNTEPSLCISISEDMKKEYVFKPYQKAGEIARKYVKDNLPPMPEYDGIENAKQYGEKCKNFVGSVMESRYQQVCLYLTSYHKNYMRKQMATKRSGVLKQQQQIALMCSLRKPQTLSTDHESRSQKRRKTMITHEDEDELSFASVSSSNLLSALERVEEKCNEDLRLLQSHTPGRSDDSRLRRFTSALQTGKQMGPYEPYRRISQVLANWVLEVPPNLQSTKSSRTMMSIDNRRNAISPYLHEEDDSQLYQLIQVRRAQLHQDEFVGVATNFSVYVCTVLVLLLLLVIQGDVQLHWCKFDYIPTVLGAYFRTLLGLMITVNQLIQVFRALHKQDEFICIATVLMAYFRTLLLLMMTVNQRNPKGKNCVIVLSRHHIIPMY